MHRKLDLRDDQMISLPRYSPWLRRGFEVTFSSEVDHSIIDMLGIYSGVEAQHQICHHFGKFRPFDMSCELSHLDSKVGSLP